MTRACGTQRARATAATRQKSSSSSVVTFDHRRRAFVHQGKLISGLLPTLQQMLYQAYDWRLAMAMHPRPRTPIAVQSASSNRSTQPKSSSTTTPTPTTSSSQKKNKNKNTNTAARSQNRQCRGISTGIKLDQQLQTCIRFARAHQLKPEVFVNSIKRREAAKKLKPDQARQLRHLVSVLMQPTLNYFRMCVMQGLSLMSSQLTVGTRHVATKMDTKLFNPATNERIQVEVKSGYKSYYHSYTGNMEAPFEDKTNSPYNQHQIQMAMTAHLHNLTYPTHPIAKSFLWRFDDKGVDQIPLAK